VPATAYVTLSVFYGAHTITLSLTSRPRSSTSLSCVTPTDVTVHQVTDCFVVFIVVSALCVFVTLVKDYLLTYLLAYFLTYLYTASSPEWATLC